MIMREILPILEALGLGDITTPAQREQLAVFAGALAEKNKVMNLTGITDPEGIALRHFYDSLAAPALERIPQGARIVDVGTGAGFPGLVLAIARPDLHVTLLDSQKKRLLFLEEVLSAAGVKNAVTAWGRAEDAGRDPAFRETFDVAVARAVAAMPVLAEYLAPFVKVGGSLLAWKGEAVRDEWDGARRALSRLGMSAPEALPYALPGLDASFVIVAARKSAPTPKAYPRKAGTPSRSPLG